MVSAERATETPPRQDRTLASSSFSTDMTTERLQFNDKDEGVVSEGMGQGTPRLPPGTEAAA